jgi:hypothetical protein
VTSAGFTGDLVGAANALVSDGGAPAPDGGSYAASDWQAAADALCHHAATQASLPAGTYWALVSGNNGTTAVDPFARMSDSDGPWALVDGTPVANTVANLKQGDLWASIDMTESGTARTFVAASPGAALAWGAGVTSSDCNGWTAGTQLDGGPLTGVAGSYRFIWQFVRNNVGGEACTQALPLYCAQVGPGAGALVSRSVPAGGKLVFTTHASYPADFAANFTADGGSVPDGGDAVHAAADAICNAEAAGKVSGTFHAWVSSPAATASTYFASLSMNGPWYRPDGTLVATAASNLTDTNGISSQIALGPDGKFVGDALVATATTATGAYDSTNSCSAFTSNSSAGSVRSGRTAYKDVIWASNNFAACSSTSLALHCFEQ